MSRQLPPLLHRTLISGTCLLVVASLLGLLARYHWIAALFGNFRPHYLLGFVTFCLCYLALGKYKISALCLVLALSNGVPLLNFRAPDFQQADPAQPTRCILLFNLYVHNPHQGIVLDWIREQDPDIVVLVEVGSAWSLAMQELQQTHPYALISPRNDSGGLAMYSRFPLKEGEVIRPGPMKRPTFNCVVQFPEGDLALMCTHPTSPMTQSRFEARNQQLSEVSELFASMKGPRLLVGDLNTTPWSPPFYHLLKETGLTRGPARASWPYQLGPFGLPLDHILWGGTLAPIDYSDGPPLGSDHRPQLFTFQLFAEKQ